MIHLRITHIVIFALLALLLTMSGAIADTPVGSAFTYQGNLSDGGTPATGIYDFQFRLFDAASGGNQESSTIVKQDVNVSNGLFNVGLDFGTIAFKGDARWLEIGVRPGSSTGSFTVLSPLQPVKPTPYAVYAPSAGTATAAPWSGLTGVPSGFSDNTDNNTTYTAGSGLTHARRAVLNSTPHLHRRLGAYPYRHPVRSEHERHSGPSNRGLPHRGGHPGG